MADERDPERDRARSDGAAEGENVVRVDFARLGAKTKKEIPRPQITTSSSTPAPRRTDLLLLEVFSQWIEQGMVQVIVDARRPDVVVPMHLKGGHDLRLNFSHRFGLADFAFDGRGVRASLSFQGRAQRCDIPWSAVWMLFSHVSGNRYVAAVSHHPEEAAAELGSVYDDVERTLVAAEHPAPEVARMVREVRENGLIIAPPPEKDDDERPRAPARGPAGASATDGEAKVIPLFKGS